MPGVLLRALSEYKFVGTPFWRMSDGKGLVRVELTFIRSYQRLDSTRRGLKAGGSLHPLLQDRRHAEYRRRWRGRCHHHRHRLYNRHRIRSSDHATIADHHQTSTSVSRDIASEESQKRVSSTSARSLDPVLLIHYDEEYPNHEKYDLQDALSNKFHGHDVAIIKAQRIPEEDEMNIDLPLYFLHRTWKKDWLLIKGSTSKYHHEEFYNKVEELAKSGKPQKNIISWFGFLERSCGDPRGKYQFVRVEPR